MVSSGQVQSVRTELSDVLSEYDAKIDELSGYWEGESYTNLTTRAKEFSRDYSSRIGSQLDLFAEACDLYQSYLTAKSNYESTKAQYQAAVRSREDSTARSLQSSMNSYWQEMNGLKSQIQEKLSSVISVQLNASSI